METTKVFFLGAAGLLALGSLNLAQANSGKGHLIKQASVTRHEAEKIALSKVPNGTVKSAELEKEHGKIVWSFDIAKPGRKDITEVLVDAKSGNIVRIENETPAQHAAEAKADQAKH